MKKKLIAFLAAIALLFGGAVALAPAASAANTYYHGHNYCLYKGIYYAGYGVFSKNTPATEWYVHVDYSWSEEFFYGLRDYEYYSHRNIYYNGLCG